MSIWETVRRALGLQRPLEVKPPGPFRLSARAEAYLAAQPEGEGVWIALHPHEGAYQVRLEERALEDLEGATRLHPRVLRVDSSPASLDGLELDHRDGHWLVTTSLTIHARETPNPHSRLYLADRPLSDAGRVFTCVRDDSPRLVRRLLERDDVLVVLARDHTLTVERTPGAAWPHIDAAVRDAVQSHWLGCGGVLPATARQPAHDPLLAAVWEVLETHVLDGIRRDGGDLELIDVEDGIAYVRLVGACRTCAAATQTLRHGVEGTLKRYFPHEIREVRTVDAA